MSDRGTVDAGETPAAHLWADWMFRAFVWVADAGPGLAVRDVQQLQHWAKRLSHDTAVSPVLSSAAQTLLNRHAELWAQHVRRGQAVELERLVQDWHACLATDEALALALSAHTLPMLAACADTSSTLRRWLAHLNRHPNQHRGDAVQTASEDDDAKSPRQSAYARLHAGLQPDGRGAENITASGGWMPAAIVPAGCVDMRLRCVAVISEAREMTSFVFRRLDGALPVYAPGQFMTIELPDTPHGRLVRSYTISSSPSRPHTLTITVRRVAGGRASTWLHEQMRPGQDVHARGPLGHFSCALQTPPTRLLMLGAGSGMTPMMSMLRWLSDTAATADVVLVQSARTAQDVVFQREWAVLAAQAAGHWAWHVVLSDPAEAGSRLDALRLRQCVPDVAQRHVWLCGPSGYMTQMSELLRDAGVPPSHLMQERFAPARPTSAPSASVASHASEGAEAVEIHFLRSQRIVTAAAGQRLLEVAEAHGIALPSACRMGQCGTCRTALSAGHVRQMQHSGHPMNAEGSAGEAIAIMGGPHVEVLACVCDIQRHPQHPLQVQA